MMRAMIKMPKPLGRPDGYPVKMKFATAYEKAIYSCLLKNAWLHATSVANTLKMRYTGLTKRDPTCIGVGAALQRLFKGNHIKMQRDDKVKYRKYYALR